MTASIGDLLAGADALAWELVSRPASLELMAGLLGGWPGLAQASVRAVDSVPLPPGERLSSVRAALVSVIELPASVVGPLDEPDPAVTGITLRLGAIADLLAGQPQAWSDTDLDAARALRSSLLAPVYAVARATLTSLDHAGGSTEARWAFRALAASTEPHALVPPAARSGRYDDLAAVPTREDSLDAAISGWLEATTRSLAGRHAVTGTGLQTAAGDALLLTAAATIANRAGAARHLVDPALAGEAERALRRAHQAWREPARWPGGVRLDGLRPVGQLMASKRLRRTLGGLRDADGWLTPAALEATVGVERLQATTRRGLHAVARVALAHYQAINNLVLGRDRLWVAAATLPEPDLRAWAAINAGGRNRWVPMPESAAPGRAMLTAASDIVTAASSAVAALDATRPPTGVTSEPSVTLSLAAGRLVAAPGDRSPERVDRVASSGAAEDRRRLPTRPEPSWAPRP